LNGNFAIAPSVLLWNFRDNDHAEGAMGNADQVAGDDNAETNAKRFRDYAAECRRLAQRAPEKDRNVLIEIAEAWIVCAQEAERRSKLRAKK
jgi:hypothetical protein